MATGSSCSSCPINTNWCPYDGEVSDEVKKILQTQQTTQFNKSGFYTQAKDNFRETKNKQS